RECSLLQTQIENLKTEITNLNSHHNITIMQLQQDSEKISQGHASSLESSLASSRQNFENGKKTLVSDIDELTQKLKQSENQLEAFKQEQQQQQQQQQHKDAQATNAETQLQQL